MKRYRIEFADGAVAFCNILLITILCLTIIGLPLGIAMLPTIYQIVEFLDVPAGR